MKKLKMDVRQFAVPSPLVGSLETHSGYGAPPFSGQDIHRMVQKRLEVESPGFIAEKSFQSTFDITSHELQISGRADGYIEGSPAHIIEIKTAFDIEELYKKLAADLNHPYIWQLRTYGYFYFKEKGLLPLLTLKIISVRNIKKSLDLSIELDVNHYEAWLSLRLKEVMAEVKVKEKILAKRKGLAETMAFPFLSPRPGQVELIDSVFRHFKEDIPLLIQAPTGLGKTTGVLYPAMKEAFARGQKVIYLTPKNSQHQAAEKAVDLIAVKKSKVKRLTLTSKSKMCLKAEPLCNPHYCEYAKDYYDKLAQHHLLDQLQKEKTLGAKKLKKLGEDFQVCPFELSVEAISFADVIIADYNYVFSPRSLVAKLSAPLLSHHVSHQDSPNLVIDEAHNLPARAQDYFSFQLKTSVLLELETAMKNLPLPFLKRGLTLIHHLSQLIKNYGDGKETKKIQIDPGPFLDLGKKIKDFALDYLASDVEIHSRDPVLRLSNLCNDFASVLEFSGEEFCHIYQRSMGDERLKVICSNAAQHLKKIYKEFKNVACFSATLKPFHYYQDLLGLAEETQTMEFASPFDSLNRKVLIIPQISTKYKDRHLNAPKICEVIERIVRLKTGNYMALFPSFEFMSLIAHSLKLLDYRILIQQKEMSSQLTDHYLEVLRHGQNPTLLLGVQGGVFSEGVDYPGEMLIGAFIVGPALPQFDFEREQMRSYYKKRYGPSHAFDYTYVFPAMARAIQSAGRVIRTETDRGLIVLIDPRFLEDSYAHSMPREWFQEDPTKLLSKKILQDVTDFWEKGASS